MAFRSAVPATVVQIVHNLDVGGLERVVISLIERIDPGRFRPVLVCLQDGGGLLSDVQARNLRIHTLRKGDGFNVRALIRLTRILRRERAGIVHCHNHGALAYGLLAVLLSRRGSVVYTAHGVYSAGRTGRVLLGAGRRRIRRVVAVSADALRVAIGRGRMDPRRTELVVNGIDVDRFTRAEDSVPVRRALGIDPRAFVFGIVARLTPVKDHGTLLRAFALVRASRPEAVLLVVGGGECEAEVRALIADLDLAGAVVMTGDRRDVPALMAAMDTFVLSSYSEGLSITLLEAMAAALPVVATRVGGNPEIVVDGVTGLLVEARDPPALAAAMTRLIDDDAASRAMGAAGRTRVAGRFGEQAMVARYESVYAAVLEEAGS